MNQNIHHCGQRRAFTLLELLVVIGILALLSSLVFPALAAGRMRIGGLTCLQNLKQWGLAAQLYAEDHDDFLPEEGAATPGVGPLIHGWYVALPQTLGIPTYEHMPWRTNAAAQPLKSLFLCPSNSRRATNDNLFHYCLNEHVDGTGADDRPTKISSIREPSTLVYLFDNGKLAAVAQQNNVHTNLHNRGAQFLFVDGHAAFFRNSAYWDFIHDRGVTNNPDLEWSQ